MNVIKRLLGLDDVEHDIKGLHLMSQDTMDSIVVLANKIGISPSELESLKADKQKMFEFIKGQALAKSMSLVGSKNKAVSEVGLEIRQALSKLSETSDKISP